MKTKNYTWLLLCLATYLSEAQERVWMDNGNPVSGRVTRALDTRLEWVTADGIPRTYHRKRFLVIFNASGDYLVVADLDNNPLKAQEQLNGLYGRPARKTAADLILKSVPFTAIPALISYESDEVINYQTLDGNPASINKKQVAAVIYRDGRHDITGDVLDVAPLLSAGKEAIAKAGADILNYKPRVAGRKQEPGKTAPKPVPTPKTVKEKPVLTPEEYKEYREKGVNRVHELTAYLGLIGDKSLKLSERNKAVEEAAQLFEPNATVAVSGSRGVNRYPVREYLNRLKLLPYSSINISWTEVKYLKELKQEADGSYYGTISGQQVFEGYGAGGKNIAYGDVTYKSVKVKLESYEKIEDGKTTINWGVLLGNIGLETDDR